MAAVHHPRDLEHALRDAAAAGALLDLSEWSHRDVPAELLNDVLTGGDESAPGPRALKLRGAHVVGPLDLEAATLRCPLRLERCELGEPITLDEASAPAIRFTACTLASLSADQLQTRGDLTLDRVTAKKLDLEGAHVGGQLSFNGAKLHQGLIAYRLQVDRDMLCREVTAKGQVSLSGAEVGGKLSFDGAKLHQDLILSGAHVGGLLSFDGAKLHQGLIADGLRVGRSMFCRNGFTAWGEVRLARAHVAGRLSFEGATLHQALIAEGMQVNWNMLCQKVTAKGEVRLPGAHVGGRLSFNGAKLHQGLIADRLQVDQDMFCDEGFSATGELVLRGAHIGGQLSFTGATLQGRDSELDQADGRGTQVALDLEAAEVGHLFLGFAARPTDPVNLGFARLRVLVDRAYGSKREWPRCRLDGCSYERLVTSVPVSVKQRLAWLPRGREEYAPQPYDQLAAAYRSAGHDAEARRVAIEKQRQRRRTLRGPARLWSLFLDATVAHGYRLWQAGAWLLVLVAVGSVLFGEVFRADEVAREDSDLTPAKSVEEVAPFRPVIYTVDLLVPVISLGQRTGWNAHSEAAQWAAFALALLGWLLTAAFVAGLAARRQ